MKIREIRGKILRAVQGNGLVVARIKIKSTAFIREDSCDSWIDLPKIKEGSAFPEFAQLHSLLNVSTFHHVVRWTKRQTKREDVMHTSNIGPETWTSFLDHLSEQYRGDPICIQVLRQETGVQSEAIDLPLMGISNDYKASGGGRIEVMAGDSPERHVTHSVFCPKQLSIVESDNGEPMAMRIVGEDGDTTLVHFGSQPRVDRTLM